MRAPTLPPAGPVRWRVPFLVALLFVSGACALVYQIAWLREFRLIFGGATPAAAAVLAVFMGGLGAGGAWIGRRAERSRNLLRLYAALEIGIGVSAALTPWLLDAARALYVRTGGVLALGSTLATVAHLLLAVVVIGPVCVLLGGNLPPAVKWVETDEDRQRGVLGLVYGGNALGAVVGVLVGTFWSLEHLGTRGTLWCAAGLNVLLGLIAWRVARGEPDLPPSGEATGTAGESPIHPRAPARFVYAAAGVTGFTFFLAELVWFRMLIPLLGGSVYCLGLILALVLLGIGVGGALYRVLIAGRPGWTNLGALAVVATAQAAALAAPWALGDRLAVVSFYGQQWRSLGFAGLLGGWSLTVAVLVLVPSVLAGLQFPLLVGLLGEGRRAAARQVGAAYAANTLGAIAGSIAGGFLLLPWLTAPGCWRLAVALAAVLGFAALLLWERPWHPAVMGATLVLGLLAAGLAFYATGPTAAWRHSALGYGVVQSLPADPASLENFLHAQRRQLVREFEGRESSIAVTSGDEGWALFSNGKADGSALSDSGTQIMLGLVSALLHPGPRSAIVVGLGTGTSAGWLADVPGMERVDVVELEPRVVEVARDYFGPVNRNAVSHPRVKVIVGDAREVLLAGRGAYDLVVSEPPNPYRAGVASLFTREYYEAVRRRLAPGGIFSQWLQGYQLSAESVQVVYATLTAVFPFVETWVTQGDDLLFVCHLEAPAYPASRLRERLEVPLFREALLRAWRVDSLEGIVARRFAGPGLAREAAAFAPRVNTDDRNLLEYGLARTQFAQTGFHYQHLLAPAVARGEDLPVHLQGELDPSRVREARLMLFADEGDLTEPPPGLEGEARARARAIVAWGQGRHEDVLAEWQGPPRSPAERLMLAISAARAGTADQAAPGIEAIRADWPADAEIASAWAAFRDGRHPAATAHLAAAFRMLQSQPWVRRPSVDGLIELSARLVAVRPDQAEALLAAWRTPLPVGQFRSSAPLAWYRLAMRLTVLRQLEVLDEIGPHFPWNREFLEFRLRALEAVDHPVAGLARADRDRLRRQEGLAFSEMLPAPAKGGSGGSAGSAGSAGSRPAAAPATTP